ncbi:hypothetical protein HDU97_009096, partial [Phlyctochytrium planicorne]
MIAQQEPTFPDTYIEVPGNSVADFGFRTSIFYDEKCFRLTLGSCFDGGLEWVKTLCAAREACGGFVCRFNPDYGCFFFGKEKITLEESSRLDDGTYRQNGWLKREEFCFRFVQALVLMLVIFDELAGVTAVVRGTTTVAGVKPTPTTTLTIPPVVTTATTTIAATSAATDSPSPSNTSTSTPFPSSSESPSAATPTATSTSTSTSTSSPEKTQTVIPGRPQGPLAPYYFFQYPGYGIFSDGSTKFLDPSCKEVTKGSCSSSGENRATIAGQICGEKDACAGYTCSDTICSMFGWEHIEMTESFRNNKNDFIFSSWIKDGATVLFYDRQPESPVITNRTLTIDNPSLPPNASNFVPFKGNSVVEFGIKTEIFWSWTDCKIRDTVSGTCLTQGEGAEEEAKQICDVRYRCGGYVCESMGCMLFGRFKINLSESSKGSDGAYLQNAWIKAGLIATIRNNTLLVGRENTDTTVTIVTVNVNVTTTIAISDFEYMPGVSVKDFGSQTSIFSDPECKDKAFGTCVIKDVAAARLFCGVRPGCAGFVCERITLQGCYLIGTGSIDLVTSQSDDQGFLQNGWIKPGTTITLNGVSKVVTLSPQPTLPATDPKVVTLIFQTDKSDPSGGSAVAPTAKAGGPSGGGPGGNGNGESEGGNGGGSGGVNVKVVIGVACGVFVVLFVGLVGVSRYALKYVREKAEDEVVPDHSDCGEEGREDGIREGR